MRIVEIIDRWDNTPYLRVVTNSDAETTNLERLAEDKGLVVRVHSADTLASAEKWLNQL